MAARAAVLSWSERFGAALAGDGGSGSGRLSGAILCFGLAAGSSTSPANASSNRLTRDGFGWAMPALPVLVLRRQLLQVFLRVLVELVAAAGAADRVALALVSEGQAGRPPVTMHRGRSATFEPAANDSPSFVRPTSTIGVKIAEPLSLLSSLIV